MIDPRAPAHQSILFLYGEVIEFRGMLQVSQVAKPVLYGGLLDMFYIGQGANFNIEIYCPKWYNHVMEYTSLFVRNKALANVKYKCNPCSDYYYTNVTAYNTITYNSKSNISNLGKWTPSQEIDNCIKCPYGALCTGNNVQPRPNYWGQWYEGQLVFYQCPVDYCCTARADSDCNVFDYCPGNRTGILCGACQEGFSVSILTGKCTHNNQCGRDEWFWIVAILATIGYALWYTVKDEIFAFLLLFPFRSLKLMKHLNKQLKLNVKGLPIKLSTLFGFNE